MDSRILDFHPGRDGYHFINRFPSVPYIFRILGLTIRAGQASNGLCGGMIYSAADYQHAGQSIPADTSAPGEGALFEQLSQRLLESFDLPLGPLRYLWWMNPCVPDVQRGIWRGRAGLIHAEWPKVRAELDAGRTCPLGLILVTSWKFNQVGHNHQVLAYGYEYDHPHVTLHIYDPNSPDDESVRLTCQLSDGKTLTRVQYSNQRQCLPDCLGFFATRYHFKQPGTV
jgi:hypothetical protein